MYTGFVIEVGEITSAAPDHLEVHAPKASGQVDAGGSVCVNGTCVSAEAVDGDGFVAAISEETRRRSTLGEMTAGRRVNIEVPLRAGDPLEGHLVQGHADAVGKVMRIDDEGAGRRVWIRPPERFLDDLVAKGSVAVDGVSLTVAEVDKPPGTFKVALIPHTLERTIAGGYKRGSIVNLEADVVARYVARNLRR